MNSEYPSNTKLQNIYPDTLEDKIGFAFIRQLVAEQCLSTLGQTLCKEMHFSPDFDTVERWLGETHEMVQILESEEEFPLVGIHDLTHQLKTIRVVGSHITEADLARLRSSLATMGAIAGFFKQHAEDNLYPRLSEIAGEMSSFPGVIAEIDRIIDKFGQIKDNASSELAHIRSELATMQGSINQAMRRVIAQAVKAGYLDSDTTPSLRDGRPVIPVAPMNKRRIPGIVHDESASGKTYYIEPAEVVEASNKLRELQLDERREILRILVELADRLRPHIPEMLIAYNKLAQFDFIHAKGRFALNYGGMMPHLHRDMQLELYHACHPVLKMTLEKQGKQIVPLDIQLNADQRLLVISGPNAGGKSVTLKTVAISQYMVQCGLLPIAYDNSHMSVVDGIYIDIGDDQSIENELSTYSSHLRNMKHILTKATNRTLVLVDEFGSGTEPQIGGALAQAMLAEFAEIGLWGVITTHYQNLKHFADQTPGLVNGSMLYDRQKMEPLFKLLIGSPGSSFAVEIARKTGLPAKIIAEAEKIVGSDYINLDKYLLDIARDKRYWENKRQQIRQKEKKIDTLIDKYEDQAEQLRVKRREIIEEARSQAREILEGSNAAVERTIQEIKESQAQRERTMQARKELAEVKRSLGEEGENKEHPILKNRRKNKKSQVSEKKVEDERPLEVGDRVLLDGAGTVGEIMEINGKNATVAFGMIKTSVKLSRLKRTIKQIANPSKSASFVSVATANAMRDRQLQFKPEIDVRGMRVDEAVQAITYFIDDAIQFNASRVRILHGTGTGALRQYIRNYLATIPSVKSSHDEDVRFGGAGITVVELN